MTEFNDQIFPQSDEPNHPTAVKQGWERPALQSWESPTLRRIGVSDAEAGINFGPEILILLS